MKRRAKIVLLWVVMGGAGCKQSSDAKGELPPATGSGVAPPSVPMVQDLMTESSAKPDAQGPRTLSGTGTLYARKEAQLGPKMTGILTQVLVEEGDLVKKGQVLFRLDASQASLGVQQARTLLEAAQVGLKSSELDYQRTKELHGRGSVPAATFDQAQARYDAARNSVAQAQVALNMAQRGATDTVVQAPIEGVVTKKLKSVGETVTLMPPTVVLVVQDVAVLELRVRLPERALGVLEPGTMLEVTFPSLGISRKVSVKRTNPAVEVMSRTVEIIADLDNTDGKLKPGMLADVHLGPAEPETAAGAPAGPASAAAARRPAP